MNNILALLGASVPAWVVDSFPTIRIIIAIVVTLLSIGLVVIVLIQPSASNGNSVITGGQSDTFYGKNQSRTLEGLLRKITVIVSITIAVLIVAYFITVIVYTGTLA